MGVLGKLAGLLRRSKRRKAAVNCSCASLVPERVPVGNVLLAYIIEPFLVKNTDDISSAHTHDQESFLMAKVFLDMGYAVDVIDYRHGGFIPKKNYDFFVSARTNLERIGRRLNEDCVKIVHLDTAHFLFNNYASYKRSLELQRRRGVTVPSKRVVENNLAIEYADYATLLGNQFTLGTYSYANKPVFPLSGTTVEVYPWDEEKNFERCRRHFLWFGATGFVHKGLDLVLEAFVQMPEYHLTVCGPVDEEKVFVRAYFKELYETENIHTVGWVDVRGERFRRVAGECLALVYPSCAEGMSGSALTCMQAGLIPVLSRESGVDVHDFGVLLQESSVDEIKRVVHALAESSPDELQRRATTTWEYARTHHTKETFSQEFSEVLKSIMNDSSGRR